MADPKLTELDDRELENQTVDTANFPYQKMRGNIIWNGSAWVKSTGVARGSENAQSVQVVDAAGAQVTSFGGTQYADGAARGTATGVLAMGDDGTNIQSIRVDTLGNQGVDTTKWNGVAPTAATAMGTGLSQTPTVPFVGAHLIARKSDSTATSEPLVATTMYDVNGSANTENVAGVSLRKAGAAGASTEYGVTTSPFSVDERTIVGTTKDVNNGAVSAGTQRVTIASDSTGQVKLAAAVGTEIGKVVPIEVTATALNTYSVRLTTNATTTPTSSTAYISMIAISTEVIGTTSTVKIQDKQGTPLVLVPSITTVATGLTVYNFQKPAKMVSGIDIVTAGAVAATVDIWIDYYQ